MHVNVSQRKVPIVARRYHHENVYERPIFKFRASIASRQYPGHCKIGVVLIDFTTIIALRFDRLETSLYHTHTPRMPLAFTNYVANGLLDVARPSIQPLW